MYNLPQEVEVWYIIPSIRKELAKLLVKEHNFTLERAGNALGVTKSAVSQYMNKKRAELIKFPAEIRKEFRNSAEIIAKNTNATFGQIMRLLAVIKKSGCSCRICKKFNLGVTKQCCSNPAACSS